MLDLILRGSAMGVMAATAAVLLAGDTDRRGALATALTALLVGCYLAASAPAAATMPEPALRIAEAGASLAPVGIAWLFLEMLTDPPRRYGPWLGLAALTSAATLALPLWPAVAPVRGGLVIALYLGLAVLAVRSDRDDLVESRRRFRRGLLAVMAATGVVISAVETAGLGNTMPAWVFPLQAGAFLLIALGFAVWALRPGDGPAPRRAAERPVPAAMPDLVRRLDALMADGIWRREGLTIGDLAAELCVPEHRLRATINGDLGHRNFPSFVNGHRIDAARAMLDDPARDGTTILEIAYEVGFASLGPFNRAFRDRMRQSPREYRAARQD